MDVVTKSDGVEWLLAEPEQSAAMIYLDPPFGHGSFGKISAEWLTALVAAAWRATAEDGITYLHCDAEFAMGFSWPTKPRGVIVWQNGWVSGFKSRSTKFWPHQHQLIAGLAGDEWRYRPLAKPAEEYKSVSNSHGNRPGPSRGFVYSDLWTDINPVDQMSFSKEKLGWKTQKPIKLLRRLIEGSTDPGNEVLDPCCGSGTTLDAAVSIGRLARGCDVSEKAVEIARTRYQGAKDTQRRLMLTVGDGREQQ